MRQTVLAIGILAAALAGCHKEKPAVSLKARLQAHQWRLTHLTYNGEAFPLEVCQLDDLQVYLDGSGYDDRGSVRCGAGDPQQSPFSYAIAPDEQTIYLTCGPDEYRYERVYCDDHSLRVTQVIQADTLVISYEAE